jgi:predicted acylesterase/phospholipase RssA
LCTPGGRTARGILLRSGRAVSATNDLPAYTTALRRQRENPEYTGLRLYRVLRLAVVLTGAVALGACAGQTRPPQTPAQLMEERAQSDAEFRADARNMISGLVARTKAESDQYASGQRPRPPVVDILIISGGGDWGAFGAGFLKGWGRIPADDPMARPRFTVVSGVSTGALIAPFAFLGDDQSLETVNHLYRNPKPDWVRPRGILYFLPSNISFAEVPGLEREMRDHVTPDMVRRIADAGADGRLLVVNTSNLDDGGPRVFDLVAESRRAVQTGNLDRIHNIILASAGIPAAFPFRIVDDQMYVDGGVTGNIIYGGRIEEEDSFSALWQGSYPGLPIPKVRYWVLFNNQLRPSPKVTGANWPSVVQRSLEMATRSSTTTALRHLLAMCEISRLKHGADIEVRIASIPGDWKPPVEGTFVKETMNNLADLGERMGADPASWQSDVP